MTAFWRAAWRTFLAVLAGAVVIGGQAGALPRAAAAVVRETTGAPAPVAVLNEPCQQDPQRDAQGAMVLTASVQCVGGRRLRTRGFIVKQTSSGIEDEVAPNCITEPRAVLPNAVYSLGDCKGVRTFQGEAIAQARIIAKYNQQGVAGSSGTGGAITPNLQWETKIDGVKTPSGRSIQGRIDIVRYDTNDPAGNVGLVEVKGDWNGSVEKATEQLDAYIARINDAKDPVMPGRRAFAYAPSVVFSDSFEINGCNLKKNPRIEMYTTTSASGADGIFLVHRQGMDCQRRNTVEHVPDTPNLQDGLDATVGVDADANGNDDALDALFNWAASHGHQYLAQMIDRSSLVTFAHPVEIRLTSRQVLRVLRNLASYAGAYGVSQAALKFLTAVKSAAVGDTPTLSGGLGAGGSTDWDAEFIRMFGENPDVSAGLKNFGSEVRAGETISAETQAAAEQQVTNVLVDTTQADATLTQAEVDAAFDEIVAGYDIDGAIEAAGMRGVVADLFEALMTAVTSEEGLALISAVVAGVGVELVIGALVLGGLWALSHWSVWGDPHMATLDGLSFDMQTVGEFHVLEIPSLGIDVQGRFAPLGLSNNISSLDRIAFDVGDSWVELTHSGKAYVDGDLVDTDANAVDLGQGAELVLNNGKFVVRFPTDDETGGSAAGAVTLTFGGWSFAAQVPTGIPTSGLLGNHDGNPANDLAFPDGTAVTNSSSSIIDGPYADAWRITDAESRFWYQPGQTTATFTNASFPSNVETLADFDTAELNAAAAACTAQNVPAGPQFQACMLDVAETGDTAYATNAAAITNVLTTPDAATVDASGHLSQSYDGAIPVNLKPTSTWTVAGSTAVGPVFDGSGYTFYVPNLPHRLATTVAFDLDAVGLTASNQDAQAATIAVDQLPSAKITFTPTNASVASGPATISSLGTGTTASGDPYQRYRVVIQGDDAASQLRVSVAPGGFRGVLGTSLAIDNLSVAMTIVPQQDFNIGLGQTVATDQPAVGAGTMENAASHDVYHFHLDATQPNDFLIWNSCPTGLTWTLSTSAGAAVRSGACGAADWRGLAGGDYLLDIGIDPTKTVPAHYGFVIQQIADDLNAGTYSLGTDPSVAATTLTLSAGQNGYLTFNGTAGQRVQFQTSNSTYPTGATAWPWWYVYAPDGTTLGGPYLNNAASSTITLPVTGTYKLYVDPRDATTGSIAVRGWTVAADLDRGNYTLGTDASANTVNLAMGAGQNGYVTFTANAGQRVQFQTSNSTYPTGATAWPWWYIYAPDGTTLAGPYLNNATSDVLTIPADGTYKVYFDPRDATAGSIDLRGWKVSDDVNGGTYQMGPFGSATTTHLTMGSGQNGYITFAGTAGQRVQFETTNSTFPTGATSWPSWFVLNPDGTQLGTEYRNNQASNTLTLPSNGTYKVLIDPTGSTTGSIDIHGWLVPADIDGGTYPLGTGTSAPVKTFATSPGQNAYVTFAGTTGQRIQFLTSNSSSYNIGIASQPKISLLRPDGTTQYSTIGDGASNPTTLTQTGTYKLLVDPVGVTQGSESLQIWTVPGDTEQAYALGTNPYVAPLALATSAGQNATVDISGTAGQVIELQTTDASYSDGSYISMYWKLYRPDGSLVTTFSGNQLSNAITLDQTGSYKVLIDPQGAASGSVSFRAWIDGNDPAADASTYHPLSQSRIVDTIAGTGSCLPSPCAKIPAGGTLTFQVTGKGGVPNSGVVAVGLIITTTNGTANGVLVAYPTGGNRGNGRTTSLTAGESVTTAAVTAVAQDTGRITIYASQATAVYVDVTGWYATAGDQSGAAFYPLNQTRVLDTRNGTGTCTPSPCSRFGAGATKTVQIGGKGGVPATGVQAVAFTLDALTPSADGHAVAHAANDSSTAGRNLTFVSGETGSALVVVPVSPDGKITINTTAAADFIIDIAGYYQVSGDGTGNVFVPYDPNAGPAQRVLDTRNGTGTCIPSSCPTLTTSSSLTVQISGHAGVPSGAVAVLMDLTAWVPAKDGGIQLWPADQSKPTGRVMSFSAGVSTSNTAIVGLSTTGTTGRVIVGSFGSDTDLSMDVEGWYLPIS